MHPINPPQPDESFAWVRTTASPALECRSLAGIAPHIFTTRAWQLGSAAPGDNGEHEDPWAQIAGAMDVNVARVAHARQVHGTMVFLARESTGELPEADIVVTNNPQLAAAVQSADCVPILIADRRTAAVAAAHAGWRGLSVRVPGATVAAMLREFGSRRKDLVAAIGPAIGACCYEVGSDVRDRFVRTGFTGDQLERWFLSKPAPSARNPSMPSVRAAPRPEHWYFDAPASAREQLQAAGIPDDQIFVADLCTASHPEWLCSYRRDGAPAGRLAAAIRSGDRHP